MDEEVLLEEQLTEAQNEIERLQTWLAEAETRTAEQETLLRTLQTSLAEREEALTAQATEAETLRTALEQARTDGKEAVSRYRAVVLAHENELPVDLVRGETVAEVELSLEEARRTVAQVRQHLEQRAQSVRVPAGSPPRNAPDLSGLSASEKIRRGLAGGRS